MTLLRPCIEMALVTRGRLSVQRVEEQTWAIIQQLAEKGGWVSDASSKAKPKVAATPKKGRKPKGAARKGKNAVGDNQDRELDDDPSYQTEEDEPVAAKVSGNRKRKAAEEVEDEPTERTGTRRSTRVRK